MELADGEENVNYDSNNSSALSHSQIRSDSQYDTLLPRPLTSNFTKNVKCHANVHGSVSWPGRQAVV